LKKGLLMTSGISADSQLPTNRQKEILTIIAVAVLLLAAKT